MAKGYRAVLRDQPMLLPPDMREWLPASHPVWLVIGAVAQLDCPALHGRRRAGGAGAAGYDPVMLASVLVWAYAHGVTSSRRIEEECRTDVAFRVICGGNAPDHVTVARFRAGLPELVEELFAAVLVLCARLGMGLVGTIALDGTKVAAAASKDANRGEEALRRLAAELAAAHAGTDAAEDALFGAGRRGDEVPAGLADPVTRGERIAAALADLEAERTAGEAEQAQRAEAEREYLEQARAGRKRRGNPPGGAAVAAARLRLERAEAKQQELAARRERRDTEARAAGKPGYPGKRPVSPERSARCRDARDALAKAEARAAAARARTAGAGPSRNLTDPHSRLMPVRGGGFIQGYNAQNVTSSDGLIIATTHTASQSDAPWFEPMLRLAQDAAALITARQPPASAPGGGHGGARDGSRAPIGLILADAGYLSEANLTTPGPDRLIATGKHRHLEKAARTAAGGQDQGQDPSASPAITAMTARLATPDGITAYRQRSHIAETPHARIKHTMKFRQHTMRGNTKTAAEWTFVCTVHNLLKAITAGNLTPATLAALTT